MFQEILTKIDFISPIFYQVLYMTVIGSIVGLIIYFIRNLFDKKISGKWKCIIWCIALITLLIPIRVEIQTNKTPVIQNEIIDRVEEIKHISNYEYAQIPQNEEIFEESKINEEQSEDTVIDIDTLDTEKQNTMPLKTIFINIIIPYIWLLGTISFIVTFLSGIKKINRRIIRNIYKDERLENILRECKIQLNIKKKVKIVLQKYKRVPSIFGIFNPSILVTEQTLEEDNETIKYIFLHELSHYKRKDIIFNFVLLCILSIHWFNPIVWFLFKKIRQDIEIGADELASKGLNQTEKKEYGMVLINLLRNRVEENYTASMLCMSDTGKNMERRIHMIKRKSTSIILSMILLIIIAGVVAGFVFIKVVNVQDLPIFDESNILSQNENVEQNNIVRESKEENTIVETSKDTALTDKEKTEIEEYINSICNWFHGALPEFNNINEADKNWIYFCLQPRVNTTTYSYSSKEEIEEDLRSLFGDDLIFDVEKDIKQNPEAYWPYYNPEDGKYGFPHFGTYINAYYVINDIKKNNNIYTVNLVEYFETDDYYQVYSKDLGEYAIVHNYQTYNEEDNHTGVFHIEYSKLDNSNESHFIPDKVLNSEVLKRKDQFRNFDVTLKKDNNGKIRITESKLVNSN